MKATILGCGGSGGVPLSSGFWGKCDPKNPKNRRLRASILVEEKGKTLLVDTSPDLRAQLLATETKRLDGVLLTHMHADHVHGIDDLRPINQEMGSNIDLFASKDDLATLKQRFAYVLEPLHPEAQDYYYKPCVTTHEIGGPFEAAGISVAPFEQNHGFSTSLGFRFGPLAYSTDVLDLDERAFGVLEGVRVWIVDCLRLEPHATHTHLEKTLSWIEQIKPERAILTHMNHSLDYTALATKLPEGVEPGFDGLVIEI